MNQERLELPPERYWVFSPAEILTLLREEEARDRAFQDEMRRG